MLLVDTSNRNWKTKYCCSWQQCRIWSTISFLLLCLLTDSQQSCHAFTTTTATGTISYGIEKLSLYPTPIHQLTRNTFHNKNLFNTNRYPILSSLRSYKGDNYNGREEIEDDGDEIVIRRPKELAIDPLIESTSFRMKRIAWLSWWAQVILTTVSSVTLLFTRNVLKIQTNQSSVAAAAAIVDRNLVPNYFLAGSSIVLSFISIFWTWATRRLSRRLLRKPTSRIQAANMLRKDLRIGIILNLLGMAFAVLGAEQIVGGLAIKVLTTTTSTPAVYQGAQSISLLQPLDILVVQANTNVLFSHFSSLVAYLFLGRSVVRLDPPSVEGDERRR